MGGGSTGTPRQDPLATRGLGAGDIAILVERDLFREQVDATDVRVWSDDRRLEAHNP